MAPLVLSAHRLLDWPAMRSALIVGGGLAGLTAAFRLQDHCKVTVLEGGPTWGGQIATTRDSGFVIERGGEGFVARSSALPILARDLGMPDALIGQSVFTSYGFDGQRLVALEPGEAATFLGFQVPKEDLGKGIRSLRGGMGSLIDALRAALQDRVEMLAGTTARSVKAGVSRAEVETENAVLGADALIVATSAASAAALADAATMSSVTVELAYPRAAIDHALDGTGFVVALAAQDAGLRACTFTTSKFIDRAPHDKVSLRLFFRPSGDDLAALDDAAWTERAVAGLHRVLKVHGQPLCAWVSRWPNALPVFSDLHRARVCALELALVPFPVLLAGSAFHGSGIDAAVTSGERAAAAILARVV